MNLTQYQAVVGSTAAEFAETGLGQHQLFPWQIMKQNQMYELPANELPSLDDLGETPFERMTKFMKTLQKEMEEGLEILALFKLRDQHVYEGKSFFGKAIYAALAQAGVDQKRASKLEEEILSKVIARRRERLGLEENEDPIDSPEVDLIDSEEFSRQLLVMHSDWLGDMQVYNRSEAMKFGIPLEDVLACIMGSNFTKLGADGEVLKNAEGKFEKGPNFIPPEDYIYATLFQREELIAERDQLVEQVDVINALAGPILEDSVADIFYTGGDEDEESNEDLM